MKILFFFLMLLMAGPLMAQKCNYTVNKKDDFTGENIHAINRTNSGWTWISTKRGSKYLIDISFMMAGENQPPMTTRDSIMVKLEDGTILKLNPSQDAAPVNGAVSRTTGGSSTLSGKYYSTNTTTRTTEVSTYWPSCTVDKEIYKKLSRSPITVIRINFTGKPYDFDLTKRPLSKTAPQIMNDARCILSIE